MSLKPVHRRHVLRGGPPAVLLALSWPAVSAASGSGDEAILQAGALTPPDQLIPSDPGALSAEELDRLSLLNGEIVRRWKMAVLPEDVFARFIGEKTSSPPSYLGEYRYALAVMRARPVGALVDEIVSASPTDPGAASVGLRRMKTFVVGEFMASNLMNEGFRQFGLTKIQGFMSGARGYARAGALA